MNITPYRTTDPCGIMLRPLEDIRRLPIKDKLKQEIMWRYDDLMYYFADDLLVPTTSTVYWYSLQDNRARHVFTEMMCAFECVKLPDTVGQIPFRVGDYVELCSDYELFLRGIIKQAGTCKWRYYADKEFEVRVTCSTEYRYGAFMTPSLSTGIYPATSVTNILPHSDWRLSLCELCDGSVVYAGVLQAVQRGTPNPIAAVASDEQLRSCYSSIAPRSISYSLLRTPEWRKNPITGKLYFT